MDCSNPAIGRKQSIQKAVNYALNHRETLCNYIKDGWCEISNKQQKTEYPPIYSRKKQLTYRSIQSSGAKLTVQSPGSIAETAKANQLKPYEYFRYLLEELSKHGELRRCCPMSKSSSRGPRRLRNAATRKRKLKTDQVCLYLPSIKGGIIFSQVSGYGAFKFIAYRNCSFAIAMKSSFLKKNLFYLILSKKEPFISKDTTYITLPSAQKRNRVHTNLRQYTVI